MKWVDASALLDAVSRLFDVDQAELLFTTVQGLPDTAAILEIGAWKGYATCALALGCIGTRKHVYTIDTFRGNPEATDKQDGEYMFDEFRKNVKHCHVVDYITPIIHRAEDYYDLWKYPLDLLLIDGNHKRMCEDYAAFYPSLKVGGWLFMHDVYPEFSEPFAHGMEFLHNLGYRRKQ